jgi:hypothetical protein
METLPPPECQQLPKRFTHLSWPNFHPKVLQIEVGKARGVGLILTEPAVKGNKAEIVLPGKIVEAGHAWHGLRKVRCRRGGVGIRKGDLLNRLLRHGKGPRSRRRKVDVEMLGLVDERHRRGG